MADEIKWITINGAHVPIAPGKDEAEAIKEFFDNIKTRNSAKNLSVEELRELLSRPTKRKRRSTTVKISADHYSRLRWMWGEYHRGQSKPITYKGYLLFNVDKTIYFVRDDDYSNFHIAKKRTFGSHHYAIEFLKEADETNG